MLDDPKNIGLKKIIEYYGATDEYLDLIEKIFQLEKSSLVKEVTASEFTGLVGNEVHLGIWVNKSLDEESKIELFKKGNLPNPVTAKDEYGPKYCFEMSNKKVSVRFYGLQE